MSEADGADARSKRMAHLEAAQREGLTLAAYSRAHGIARNRLYEEKAASTPCRPARSDEAPGVGPRGKAGLAASR
jgi:hypothetical protein